MADYELKPVTGGIEVTLSVDEMPLATKTAKEMQRGGMFILDNLKSIVETGRPPLMTRVMYQAMGAFESLLPKCTRSDRWPLETLGKDKR